MLADLPYVLEYFFFFISRVFGSCLLTRNKIDKAISVSGINAGQLNANRKKGTFHEQLTWMKLFHTNFTQIGLHMLDRFNHF